MSPNKQYKNGMSKFSSKPPEHEAARLRENQRRHRARVKGRITELETALAVTEEKLDGALRLIEELKAEVQRLQRPQCGPGFSQERGHGRDCPGEPEAHRPEDGLHQVDIIRDDTAENRPLPSSGIEKEGIKDVSNDCAFLPPPQPGESTMTCREAFSIIKERIMPEFDLDQAREWLKPGFRRATCPGTGCRVQTHILFSFSSRASPHFTVTKQQNQSKPHDRRPTNQLPTHPNYPTQPAAMSTPYNPLGHISIGVRDYDVSKAFYTAVFATIGLHLVYDSEAVVPKNPKKIRTLGFGPDEQHELINIFEFGDDAAPPGAGFHLAFNAPTRASVVEFHAVAVGFGGTNNGLPGVRKHYGDDYFAAFVVDPDGWRLEVVCKTPVALGG
ncbi:Glyoxalase/Bleomycin resistance protein/Dihydroxybiphenyl dioxygenase [Bombardia bombarda]|uniref:Glyoxalase/Bleomycin resistance protein/Dihydroxybiphenyl dioxygenase n=1 Tax=Bombardia bombarda TaxID=252184 RepID=A0AA39WHV2_9PEZI|nr:Glyoxalase/Bleomycin resistance protein/Dihydroxybiphenyl dioxygenase [Bombardia bombarda]